MKITIDTKEDSPEEIRRAILLLQQLSNTPIRTNAPSVFDTPATETSGLMGMFNATPPEPEENKEEKEEEIIASPKIELF
jgi:hypothetical protein